MLSGYIELTKQKQKYETPCIYENVGLFLFKEKLPKLAETSCNTWE